MKISKNIITILLVLFYTVYAGADMLVNYDFTGTNYDEYLANKGTGTHPLELSVGPRVMYVFDENGQTDLALEFLGTGQYAVIGTSDLNSVANDVTVALWFKSTYNNGIGDYLIGCKDANCSTLFLENGQRVGLGFTAGDSNSVVYGSSNVDDEEWHFLAFTFDGEVVGGVTTGDVKLYVDGYLEGSETLVGTTSAGIAFDEFLSLGARHYTYIDPDFGFEVDVINNEIRGYFDDVKIFNEAKSFLEIRELGGFDWAPDPEQTVVYADEATSEVYSASGIARVGAIDEAYWLAQETDPVWFVGGSDANVVDANQEHSNGSLILAFALPDEPMGNAVESADVQVFQAQNIGNPGGTVDLYGLGWIEAADVNDFIQSTDWFVGNYGHDVNGATAIQSNMLDANNMSGWRSVTMGDDVQGPERLRCWLQAQYDDGAVGGDYVFFRLNFRDFADYQRAYSIATGMVYIPDDPGTTEIDESAIVADAALKPRLQYSFTDNPSGLPQCPAALEVCLNNLNGDINGDCKVNIDDILLITNNWLECVVSSYSDCQ